MAANLLLVAGSVLVVAAVGEVLLRAFPGLMPAGTIGAPVYDPELGLRVHGAPVIYNKTRFIRRLPNRDGFMDADHTREKPPGSLRAGFFGDSYVEALQVPLESTFFMRLPREIAGRRIEPLAFGISGWGTLHSMMAYRAKGHEYDLDVVVYAFVANDPGDHAHAFASTGILPAAVVANNAPGYELEPVDGADYFVRHDRTRYPRRAVNFVLTRSLFAQLVHSRANLLVMSFSTPVEVAAAEPGDGEPTSPGRDARTVAIDKNDPPDRWPTQLRVEIEHLTGSILAGFAKTVRADGRQFAVLYVPRGEAEVEGRLSGDASWYPWLSAACAELGVPLIDPRAALRRRLAGGDAVYDDHWTEAGHEVVSEVVAGFLAEQLSLPASGSRPSSRWRGVPDRQSAGAP